MAELIRSSPSDVWGAYLKFFLNMVEQTIKPSDSLKEIYLTENGINLFLHLIY
jgi:hypothetical protein